MQSYMPLVPITGINEEFCFCFLLVAWPDACILIADALR